MSLMASKKMNLLKQLVDLSNDKEILPFIDEQTASRIKEILEQNQSLNFLQEYQDLEKNFNKIRSRTQMDEMNRLYDQKFPNLFEEDSSQALKQINVGLESNKKLISKSNTQSKINRKVPLSHQDNEKIISLESTCSKFNTLKFHETNKENFIDKRKSKQKIISYKVGKQTPKFYKNSQSSSQITKIQSIQKTPQKKSISKANSKSNLKSKQTNTNIKKSQSKKNNLISRLISSSVKHENFSALKSSQSKNSLLSTHKIKSSIKQQKMQETVKRQIKSFSSVQNFSQIRNSTSGIRSKERNKSKENNNKKKEMLRKINKMKTQFSTQSKYKKVPLFFQEAQDQQYKNFDEKNNIQKDRRIATQTPSQNIQSEKQFSGSINHFESKNCLKEIIVEIYSQQNQKIQQKQKLQDKIQMLKQKIASQNRKLQQVTKKNNKIVRQIQTLEQFQKSVTQQRQSIQKSLIEIKKKIKSLKKSLTQKSESLKKIVQNQIKQQQQLIEMYENVIDELRKEIRQQNRKKSQIKGFLQKSQKNLENKQSRFNSTLMSTQKIKNNLTDAFKEWV